MTGTTGVRAQLRIIIMYATAASGDAVVRSDGIPSELSSYADDRTSSNRPETVTERLADPRKTTRSPAMASQANRNAIEQFIIIYLFIYLFNCVFIKRPCSR